MSSQSSSGRRRQVTSSSNRLYSAEDQALNMISKEAEARLAAKRAARAEARDIRMKEIEKQQKRSEETQDKVYELTNDHAAARVRQQLAGSRRGSTDSNESFSDARDDYKADMRELEDKYKAAMMTSAQLDNEKQSLVYQVELLKDQLEEQDEGYTELQKEYRDKCRECEFQKRDLKSLEHELDILKQQLAIKDRLIEESGFVIVSSESGEPILQKQLEESAASNGTSSSGAVMMSPEARKVLEKAGGTTLGSFSTLSQPSTKPSDCKPSQSFPTIPALATVLDSDIIEFSSTMEKLNLQNNAKSKSSDDIRSDLQSRVGSELLHDDSGMVTNMNVVCEHELLTSMSAQTIGQNDEFGSKDSGLSLSALNSPKLVVGGDKEEEEDDAEFFDAVSTPSPFKETQNKSAFDLEEASRSCLKVGGVTTGDTCTDSLQPPVKGEPGKGKKKRKDKKGAKKKEVVKEEKKEGKKDVIKEEKKEEVVKEMKKEEAIKEKKKEEIAKEKKKEEAVKEKKKEEAVKEKKKAEVVDKKEKEEVVKEDKKEVDKKEQDIKDKVDGNNPVAEKESENKDNSKGQNATGGGKGKKKKKKKKGKKENLSPCPSVAPEQDVVEDNQISLSVDDSVKPPSTSNTDCADVETIISEDAQNIPNSGDAQNIPNSGDAQNIPNSGDAQNIPNSGDAQNIPNSGDAQNIQVSDDLQQKSDQDSRDENAENILETVEMIEIYDVKSDVSQTSEVQIDEELTVSKPESMDQSKDGEITTHNRDDMEDLEVNEKTDDDKQDGTQVEKDQVNNEDQQNPNDEEQCGNKQQINNVIIISDEDQVCVNDDEVIQEEQIADQKSAENQLDESKPCEDLVMTEENVGENEDANEKLHDCIPEIIINSSEVQNEASEPIITDLDDDLPETVETCENSSQHLKELDQSPSPPSGHIEVTNLDQKDDSEDKDLDNAGKLDEKSDDTQFLGVDSEGIHIANSDIIKQLSAKLDEDCLPSDATSNDAPPQSPIDRDLKDLAKKLLSDLQSSFKFDSNISNPVETETNKTCLSPSPRDPVETETSKTCLSPSPRDNRASMSSISEASEDLTEEPSEDLEDYDLGDIDSILSDEPPADNGRDDQVQATAETTPDTKMKKYGSEEKISKSSSKGKRLSLSGESSSSTKSLEHSDTEEDKKSTKQKKSRKLSFLRKVFK